LGLIYRQKKEPKVLMNDGLVGHSLLLPYGKADTKVYALLAFGQGPGWISCTLSPAEIAAAYDLPVRLQKYD
jgi:hypothetical protein